MEQYLVYFVAIPDPNDLQSLIVSRFEASINGQQYYTGDSFLNHLLDVSTSGQSVLLSAQQDDSNLDTYFEPTFFILWNPPVTNGIQAFQIPGIEAASATAAFSPFSDHQLLLWQPSGLGTTGGILYLYDLISHERYILEQIDPAYEPRFSPDGEWMSYSTDTELVFLSIRDLLPGVADEFSPKDQAGGDDIQDSNVNPAARAAADAYPTRAGESVAANTNAARACKLAAA